ncbi:MAG TPA: sigma-70 family RNA polymerase sigma factor [Candidatus Acidoferrum sp.]|nr:sigma-70 family RNA polymerase sigma factor [Candidatus Acidoferrum sp.]
MAARKPATKVIREDAGERLLVEAAQRDPAKFGELYDIHFERIYAFVARRVSDRDKAEDLTSEVFHKALANLKRYEWRGAPFGAWLFRIATNAISDLSKRAAREPMNVEDPPEPSAEPEQEAIEYRARLFRLVEKLPVDQRRVVFGRFVEQRSIREIAQQLGKSEGAVKQLQFRALEKLRSQMEGAHA